MIKVRGIYDGAIVRLLEPISVPPETEVEVLIPDPAALAEEAFRRSLIERGIITPADHLGGDDDDFEPIPNPGEPISDTIVRERR